jgi:hypothetical protein
MRAIPCRVFNHGVFSTWYDFRGFAPCLLPASENVPSVQVFPHGQQTAALRFRNSKTKNSAPKSDP